MEAGTAAFIILNLIIIEGLLSIDNAAVLAVMVSDLPGEQRNRALKYGILGAYVFRGICLVLAEFLIGIWWLKPLGGLYLLYLMIHFFYTRAKRKKDVDEAAEAIHKAEPAKKSRLYRATVGRLGKFWTTVILVEIMDLAFSIDNVFAAVALAPNHIWLVMVGVFIGILAMRFIAQGFVKLLERFPVLETTAFVVIGVLGIKLFISLPCHFGLWPAACDILESESSDKYFSILTLAIFILPVGISWLRGRRAA